MAADVQLEFGSRIVPVEEVDAKPAKPVTTLEQFVGAAKMFGAPFSLGFFCDPFSCSTTFSSLLVDLRI